MKKKTADIKMRSVTIAIKSAIFNQSVEVEIARQENRVNVVNNDEADNLLSCFKIGHNSRST